LQLQLAISV